MSLRDPDLHDPEVLAAALAAGGLGTWHWDRATNVVRWSHTLEAMFGLEPGSFPGTFDAWAERLHPEDRAGVLAEVERTLATGVQHRVVHRIVLPSGEVRWIEGEGRLYHDDDGAAIGMIGVSRDVTVQRRAELAARELEDRFRLMANRAPVLMWLADDAGEVTWINRPWLSFTGRTLERELGRGWIESIHRDDADRCAGILAAAFARRTPFVLEFRLRRHDGAWRWILFHGVPIDSPDTTGRGWIGTGVEIHARIEAEREREELLAQVQVERARLAEANVQLQSQAEELESQADALRRQSDALIDVQAGLRESQERYRSFIEQTREAMWRFELDEPIDVTLPVDEQVDRMFRDAWLAECNDACAHMYGYTYADELTGRRLAELLEPDDERNRAYLGAFAASGYRLSDAESQEHDREGNSKVFLNSLVGIVADGRLLRAWGTQRDVTARRRAEEALAFLADASRALVESYDPEALQHAVVRAAVPRLADACAIVAEGLDGRPVDLARAPEATAGAETARVALPLVARGQRLGELVLVQHSPGRGFAPEDMPLIEEFARRAALALDNARLLSETRDSERNLERLVEEKTEDLRQTIQQLNDFTQSISHDLRAPIRAMRGYADALTEDFGPALGDAGRGYARRIAVAAERMNLLITDLLEYSRLSQHDLSLAPVAIAPVFDEAMLGLEAEIRERRAEVSAQGLDTLPPVMAHRATLQQVLSNLIGNAIKFTAPGETAEVRVTGELIGRRVCVSVEDHGIGIEAGHIERIFGVFQRLHGTDQYPGTGVGLAIVRKAMERMGGEVRVVSTPGQGSRFTIELAAMPTAESPA